MIWRSFFAHEHAYWMDVLQVAQGGLHPRDTTSSKPHERNIKIDAGSMKRTIALNFQDSSRGVAEPQPKDWTESRLVVVDPFITTKVSSTVLSGPWSPPHQMLPEQNCARACAPHVQTRFQYECQRAVSLLEEGCLPSCLFGDALPHAHHDRVAATPKRGGAFTRVLPKAAPAHLVAKRSKRLAKDLAQTEREQGIQGSPLKMNVPNGPAKPEGISNSRPDDDTPLSPVAPSLSVVSFPRFMHLMRDKNLD